MGNRKVFWAGLRHAEPNASLLACQGAEANFEKLRTTAAGRENDNVSHRDWDDGHPEFCLQLDDEKTHFFAITEESQRRSAPTSKGACGGVNRTMSRSPIDDRLPNACLIPRFLMTTHLQAAVCVLSHLPAQE
jgi:hypothetical protein